MCIVATLVQPFRSVEVVLDFGFLLAGVAQFVTN